MLLMVFFYLLDESNMSYLYLSYFPEDIFDKKLLETNIENLSFTKLIDFDDKKILLIPLDKGVFAIVYEKTDVNFEFLLSMFQDLIVKLNISIDACLNVQRMKNKNAMLNSLTNELKEQQKQLIESDKYKNDFLANMSHELKTPLNSIIVISSIMAKNKNKKLDDEQIKNMKIINTCGNDLLFLINDILDISKIEAGEISLNLSKIDINKLIEELVSEMNPLANQKELTLEFTCFINEITLLSDSHRIKQILKNLLSNAIKFTQKGTVSIILEENTNDITIKVIDEGIGIAKDKLNHIFERFKQADGSTTRKYGGTGLGLAISKELAILLGGDIKAFSTLEKGSTFELILPKKTNIQNISDDKVTISSRENNTIIEDIVFFDMEEENIDIKNPIIEKNKDLLIINSDPAFFFPLAVSLKKENIKLDYSKSIEESYKKLDKSYDLLLLDDKDLNDEVEDFISYCLDKNINFLILSFKLMENNNKYVNKSLSKIELLNDILNKLEK
ncbi:two-component system sensor histidine kinase [Arcobacter acticola]|uniref:histidine kinase n=1 Tax=Arcobacter acticola TaxID=1849015 RepID=A0A6M8EGH9_9BACT|nr:HAMP domain-containing sensor histidine kinase [Arcobacter acticola]QKE29162.1 two-component system sensor histidine kinase [Arcobacter acticola]